MDSAKIKQSDPLPDTPSSGVLIHPSAYYVPVLFLVGLMLCSGAATYFIPPGCIDPVSMNWEPVDTGPLSWWNILLAPVLCLSGPTGLRIAGLIVCIILIGASFALMNESGAVLNLIKQLAAKFGNRRELFLVITTTVFALMGSTLGMMEEITPMLLFFVPLALRMHWDRITGMAIPFAGAGCGFAAATLNPFTLGAAQGIAGVPMFSGLGLRSLLFVAITGLMIGYMVYYTRKLKSPPITDHASDALHGVGSSEEASPNQLRTILPLLGCFFGIVIWVLCLRWITFLQAVALPPIALLFVGTSFLIGRLHQLSWKTCFSHFGSGVIAFSPALILILMAASIPYLLETGMIKDTIFHRFSSGIMDRNLPVEGIAALMYLFQMMLNLLIPSGTGQAFLTVPILIELDPRLSAQTVVLIFHCGDGFSNLIWPTNPLLMVALGLAGIRYKQWFRFILPLQFGLFGISLVFILFAVWTGYGFN